jgi:hypothetical protein
MTENKVNAHAGMPFCGVSRFVVSAFFFADFRQQPVWGVGRLRLSVRGSLEPHLGKCNDLRLFCFLQKLAWFLAEQGQNSFMSFYARRF